MVQEAEFEEREYERPLLSELAGENPQVWTPGQVLEFHLGFDASLEAATHPIWAMLGYDEPLRGIRLRDVSEGGNKAATNVPTDRMPDFNANLFVQAKRSTLLQYRTRGLKTTTITRPYWRFQIESHQHELLLAITAKVKPKAAVIYAAPAFHTMVNLARHAMAGQVAEHSTFVRPEDLSSHTFWAYDSPGNTGYGCSRPEHILSPDVREQIKHLSQYTFAHEVPSPEVAGRAILDLAGLLREVVEEVGWEWKRLARFLDQRYLIVEAAPSGSRDAVRAFVEIQLLMLSTGLQWLVVGR